jgi:hypothetical protein
MINFHHLHLRTLSLGLLPMAGGCALEMVDWSVFIEQGGGALHQQALSLILRGSAAIEVGDDGLGCLVHFDHLLMVAPALHCRSAPDVLAQHSIQMIFSFLESIAVDQLQESLEELHVLPVFFLGPV